MDSSLPHQKVVLLISNAIKLERLLIVKVIAIRLKEVIEVATFKVIFNFVSVGTVYRLYTKYQVDRLII